MKPFINKYKCEGIHFPSEKDDWRKIEKNLLMFCLQKKEKMYPGYFLKHNSNCENYSFNDFIGERYGGQAMFEGRKAKSEG